MTQEAIHQCECSICQQPGEHPDKELHYQMNLFLTRLDEQQRRWYAALESKKLGHGGGTRLSEITGMDVETIRRGRRELEHSLADRPVDRIRLPGGGRHRVEKKPGIKVALEALVEGETAGDPTGDTKWVRSSLRHLSTSLGQSGYVTGYVTIGRLLKDLGYSLKSNRKRFTGPPHPDRDRQFRYIKRVTRLFLGAGHPTISVDGKKKELIGNFANAGRAWCREPEEVNVHDFRQDAVGRAAPYGIYDLRHNLGYVAVGTSAETPEFVVDAIAWWWQLEDRPRFPNEKKMLILCDAGGGNGYRPRLWKKQIQEELADRFGIEVMVCHYPTGASKWNPVEYRLFSPISLNWAGKPLRSFDIMLAHIQGTTTATGLEVKACLLDQEYKTGIKVSGKEMAALNLVRRRVCPNWNYIIKPRRVPP